MPSLDSVQPYALKVVYIAFGILILWELYTVFNHRPNDTISATVWYIIRNSKMIVFLTGMLCGHFFLYSWENAYVFVAGCLGGALAWKKGEGNHL